MHHINDKNVNNKDFQRYFCIQQVQISKYVVSLFVCFLRTYNVGYIKNIYSATIIVSYTNTCEYYVRPLFTTK